MFAYKTLMVEVASLNFTIFNVKTTSLFPFYATFTQLGLDVHTQHRLAYNTEKHILWLWVSKKEKLILAKLAVSISILNLLYISSSLGDSTNL